MISEDTVYDRSEETRLDMPVDEKKEEKTVADSDKKKEAPAPKKGAWKTVAMGTGTGIVFGAAAGLFTSATPVGNAVTEEAGHTEGPQQTTQTVVDEGISMATGVDDEMTFSQAFRAARIEVGAGGAFEWRGQTYSTYYAEEWESMTPEQQAEYNNHFAWSSGHGNGGDTAAATGHADSGTDVAQEVHHEADNSSAGTEQPQNGIRENDTQIAEEVAANDVSVIGDTEPEIEPLGVYHDPETNMNVVTMNVDGQEVLLVDVDGGGGIEMMAVDVNGDGQISGDEMVDISSQNLTIDDFGGLPPQEDGFLADASEPDYINGDGCYGA